MWFFFKGFWLPAETWIIFMLRNINKSCKLHTMEKWGIKTTEHHTPDISYHIGNSALQHLVSMKHNKWAYSIPVPVHNANCLASFATKMFQATICTKIQIQPEVQRWMIWRIAYQNPPKVLAYFCDTRFLETLKALTHGQYIQSHAWRWKTSEKAVASNWIDVLPDDSAGGTEMACFFTLFKSNPWKRLLMVTDAIILATVSTLSSDWSCFSIKSPK